MRQGVKPVFTECGRSGRHWMEQGVKLVPQEVVGLGGIGWEAWALNLLSQEEVELGSIK